MAGLPLENKQPLAFAGVQQNAAEDPSQAYIKAATIGVVAGMRSMLPLALLNWTKEEGPLGPEDAENMVKRVLSSPGVQFLASSAAVGEVLGDKLPITPSRTSSGPFAGRIVIGAIAGMTVCRRYNQSPLVGAALGAAGAGAGTLLGYYSRIALAQSTNVSDTMWGLAEDLVALGLGLYAIRAKR